MPKSDFDYLNPLSEKDLKLEQYPASSESHKEPSSVAWLNFIFDLFILDDSLGGLVKSVNERVNDFDISLNDELGEYLLVSLVFSRRFRRAVTSRRRIFSFLRSSKAEVFRSSFISNNRSFSLVVASFEAWETLESIWSFSISKFSIVAGCSGVFCRRRLIISLDFSSSDLSRSSSIRCFEEIFCSSFKESFNCSICSLPFLNWSSSFIWLFNCFQSIPFEGGWASFYKFDFIYCNLIAVQ